MADAKLFDEPAWAQAGETTSAAESFDRALERVSGEEFDGWNRVRGKWARRFPGVDFDDGANAPLVKAMEAWAERRARVRIQQGDDMAKLHELVYVQTCRRMGLAPLPIITDLGVPQMAAKGKRD